MYNEAQLIFRRRLPKLEKTSVGFAIVATGFMGMAFSMVLILAFQSLFGYVYQMIALIIAAFMLGIALGSTTMSHLMHHVTNDKSLLIKLESAVLAYSALVPIVLVVFHSHLGQPVISVLVQVVILILSVIPGILVGAEFPLANKIYLKGTGSVGQVSGTLYACDLLGSWIAALFVSIWLIPVLGILNTCILIACLKVVSLFLVATSKL